MPRQPLAWIPFLLFIALLASGFVVFGKRSSPSAAPPATESDACLEEGDGVPAPASSDLRVLEDELYRAVTLALGDELALSAEQESTVRRALQDGLEATQSVWKSGERATVDARLDSVYAKTRASLQTLLTEAQWQRLQTQGPFERRR